jgi:hypothetical protein
VQSKLDELHNGFDTSMHAIHAFRNREDEGHSGDGAATLHTNVNVNLHEIEQLSGVSDVGGASIPLRGGQASDLQGGALSGRSDHERQQGHNGDCAKNPVKLKSEGWHVEADACTGASSL